MTTASDEEFERLALVLRQHGSTRLIEELTSVRDWDRHSLSELMVCLALEGGVGWPTKLVEMGADVNFRDDEGQTALSCCVYGAMTEFGQPGNDTFATALELLSLGVDPNDRYSDFSIVDLAVHFNQPLIVCALMIGGADLDHLEPDGVRTTRQVLERSPYAWANLIARLAKGN